MLRAHRGLVPKVLEGLKVASVHLQHGAPRVWRCEGVIYYQRVCSFS